MSIVLDTEVILTSILTVGNAEEGVTYSDIRKYCDGVKGELLAKCGCCSVSFGISNDELTRCVKDYPGQFMVCGGKYRQGGGMRLISSTAATIKKSIVYLSLPPIQCKTHKTCKIIGLQG